MNQLSSAVQYLEGLEKRLKVLEEFHYRAAFVLAGSVRFGPITPEEELRLAKGLNIHVECAKGALEEFARGRGLL